MRSFLTEAQVFANRMVDFVAHVDDEVRLAMQSDIEAFDKIVDQAKSAGESVANKIHNEEYIKGKEAHREGIGMMSCPYEEGSVGEMLWCTGWLVAKQDAGE